MNRLLKLVRIAALVAAIMVAGWLGWQQFGVERAPQGNLAGSSLGGAFRLVDQNGAVRTEADFRGQWRLIYFGYTFCPDVCPTDMAIVGQAMKRFETSHAKLAASVTPIFISVDPERDRPAALKPFVAAFHPRFVGLTGSQTEVDAAMKTFGVYARKVPTRDPANYLVDHFAVFYLFGPDGQPIAFLPHGSTATDLANMLETYVR